jgi:hypothetical protein
MRDHFIMATQPAALNKLAGRDHLVRVHTIVFIDCIAMTAVLGLKLIVQNHGPTYDLSSNDIWLFIYDRKKYEITAKDIVI